MEDWEGLETAPKCPYCSEAARFEWGVEVYPHRPDLAGKGFWVCWNCSAWVGCHPNSFKPLGRLANAELRAAKQAAHVAFDPLWKQLGWTRSIAYFWMAKKLGIPREEAHIGMFDVDRCQRLVKACREERECSSPSTIPTTLTP